MDPNESPLTKYFSEPFARDGELLSLVNEIDRVLGAGAMVDAINQTARAPLDKAAAGASPLATEAEFNAALKIELRRRLQPH